MSIKRNSAILVTGANGLAGSAVVNYLREQEFTCVIPLTRKDVDLRNNVAVHEVFNRIKPDYVFHAAATVYGLVGNMQNQYQSILDNTVINVNTIDAARTAHVKKFIAMGTNAIYPAGAKLPYIEDDIFDGRPHDGEAGYAHAKRLMLAMLEAGEPQMPFTYLASGNLYGERDRFNTTTGHVLPSLIKKFYDASRDPDAKVVIWGDGSTARDFLHSEDLARIVELSLDNDAAVGAINTGSGVTYPLDDIARRLSGISGVDYSRVVYDMTKPMGRRRCCSDLSKLHSLGFIPQINIGHGLQRTYDWYAEQRRP